ncbi:MAG: Na+/H+ antiporter NhaC family protein [Planctomycetota bacterium]
MSHGTQMEVPSRTARYLPLLAVVLVALVLAPWRGASDEQLAEPPRRPRLRTGEARRLITRRARSSEGETTEDGKWPTRSCALLDDERVAFDAEANVATLTLGRVEFVDADGSSDPRIAEIARRSFLQGLRTAAELRFFRDGERRKGAEVKTVGEREAAPGGLDVVFRLGAADGAGLRQLSLEVGEIEPRTTDWNAPTRFSLLPPVIAIALAIATRRPLFSLFSGVIVGAVLVELRNGTSMVESVTGGLYDVPTHYFWDRFANWNNLQIVLFVVFMLAMVGNAVRNGGIAGIMEALAKRAKDARSTQVATWLTGLAVFFDDYANTVLVGSTMRPLTDRFKVAREKLAYIVDSTSAPVAGISIFSTWIAFEVSTFSAQLPAANMATTDGYRVFVDTLPFRFYCIFTLAFVAMIAFSGRDFGPMGAAERRARRLGKVLRDGATPLVSSSATEVDMAEGVQPRAWRALVPLLGFIGTTLFMIAFKGGAFRAGAIDLSSWKSTMESVTTILYDGSGNFPLMVGGITGFVLAAIATISAGIPKEVPRAAWTTLRSMGVAFGILYSAWMVSDVCGELGTAQFLTAIVSDAIGASILPVVLILMAGIVAFATGSSWSTMGILLPMVVGVSYQLGEAHGMGGYALMVLCIGAVLEGSIFGDHCSPISDTTVLSSISSASDHIDHVKTQAPYALLCMGTAMFAGYVPAAFLGWNSWITIPLGLAILAAFVFGLGKRSEPEYIET